MSLFTARDWWVSPSAQDTDEEYDVGSLVVGNFDNVNGADDVVITGSLGGVSTSPPFSCLPTRQSSFIQPTHSPSPFTTNSMPPVTSRVFPWAINQCVQHADGVVGDPAECPHPPTGGGAI